MNRYLVYLAGSFQDQPGGLLLVVDALERVGQVTELSDALFVVETRLHGTHVQEAIERVRAGPHDYFVTDTRRLGFGGSQRFALALGLSGENRHLELDLTAHSVK